MEGKKGFGKSGRNEGYKGASRGGSYSAGGGKSFGARGGKSADSRGTGAEFRGGGSRSGSRDGFSGARDGYSGARDGQSGSRGGQAGARSDRSGAWGSKNASEQPGSQSGRFSNSRGGKPQYGISGKFPDSRGDRAQFGQSGKSTGYGGGKPKTERSDTIQDSWNAKSTFDYSGQSSDFEGTNSSFDRKEQQSYTIASNPRGANPRGTNPRGVNPRGTNPRGANPRGTDARGPKRDEQVKSHSEYKRPNEDSVEEKGLPAEDITLNQDGDLDKLEGRNSVLEALKAGRSINRIYVAKGEREGSVNQIIAMARQSHILIQEIDRAKLDAMSLTHSHQGVIALTAAKDYVEVDEILKIAAESGRPPFLIVLDEITDSHNLGSILRTANAAGVHGVIIPKRRAVGLTSVVSKASAGAIEYVPVARVTNIAQTLEALKKKNIWVVGTDTTGEKAYFEADLTGPVALVIGSEGEGMGKLVRESCDFVVNLPMMGQITSLNAAVAGAIVTYEILRQRKRKNS